MWDLCNRVGHDLAIGVVGRVNCIRIDAVNYGNIYGADIGVNGCNGKLFRVFPVFLYQEKAGILGSVTENESGTVSYFPSPDNMSEKFGFFKGPDRFIPGSGLLVDGKSASVKWFDSSNFRISVIVNVRNRSVAYRMIYKQFCFPRINPFYPEEKVSESPLGM